MKTLATKRRWLTIGLLTMLIIIGPTSCYLLETCPDEPPHFSIHGIGITNFAGTDPEFRQWQTVQENESIKASRFFMSIEFEKKYHAKLKSAGGANLYALSCNEPGDQGSLIGLDTLYLITLQDYTNQYAKNDTLNNILLISDYSYSSYYPLQDYISENSDIIYRQDFRIRLQQLPSNKGDFKFKLIYILKNGDRFESTSDVVRLER